MQRRQLLFSVLVGASASWLSISICKRGGTLDVRRGKLRGAQQSGARILVDISATWCPTCRGSEADHEILLADQPANQDIIIFAVDFDSQKPVVRQFGATW